MSIDFIFKPVLQKLLLLHNSAVLVIIALLHVAILVIITIDVATEEHGDRSQYSGWDQLWNWRKTAEKLGGG